jgi:hypothetical protein
MGPGVEHMGRCVVGDLINGIAKRVGHVRIALIPLGTGNDFARCLNLPKSSLLFSCFSNFRFRVPRK